MARMGGLGGLVVFVWMAGCGWRAGHPLPPDAGPIFIGDASVSEAGSDHAVDLDGSSPDASRDAGDDGMIDAGADAIDVEGTSSDGPEGDAESDGPDAFAAVRVWTDDSTAIDVSCAGHHEGQMRFRARRDQLSADQLALLANVTTAPPQPGPPAPDACVPDLLSCTVTISGAGGASASYFVWAFDYACGGHDNLLSDSTFRPFRASLPCRYGLEVGPGSPVLPPLGPDERCFHGFVPAGVPFPDPVLAVDASGHSRHVELDGCSSAGAASSLLMQIRSEDGATVVADGAPAADPGADRVCLGLDHTFATAGNYRLHVASVNDAGFPNAWFFYRFY